jgi:hypothetical protein
MMREKYRIAGCDALTYRLASASFRTERCLLLDMLAPYHLRWPTRTQPSACTLTFSIKVSGILRVSAPYVLALEISV